jgi:hypothetical protein
MNEDDQPLERFEGRGKTLEEALEKAAEEAIRKNVANDGKQYVVLYHLVKVSNPRISEHLIALVSGGG